MAYGKIKADALIHDDGGTDTEVTVASIAAKASLASPTFTGTPAAPTAVQGTNTTQIATTAFVNAEISADLTAAIGSTVQAFDTNTAKTDVSQTFGPAQIFTAASVHNGGIDSNGSVDVLGSFNIDGPYRQTAEAVSALDIDLSTGNYFTKSLSTSSTVTFSNPPASGTVGSFILELTLTGTGTAVTWPNTVYWNNDAAQVAPTLVDARTHLFMFVTSDGGTKYRGAVVKDYTA